MHTPIDEATIRAKVKSIVKERGTGWIPDKVEESLYTNAILALMGLLDAAINDVTMTFMGHELKMDIRKQDMTVSDSNTIESDCESTSADDDGMLLRSGRVVKRRGIGRLFGR